MFDKCEGDEPLQDLQTCGSFLTIYGLLLPENDLDLL